jgi:hypothetical protein
LILQWVPCCDCCGTSQEKACKQYVLFFWARQSC